MSSPRPVIALAGVGNLGRYICEELVASAHFDVVVLSRGTPRKWLQDLQVSVFVTDYTTPSILSILSSTRATTLVSFINITTPAYITVHAAILDACRQSKSCQRLIPSEWIGDVETHPRKPDFYATTRLPFRDMLRAQEEVEWTLFNMGWLADYFLPEGKSYMPGIKDEFPVDVDGWKACIRGSGDELQSWTSARDVARAVVELCRADEWDQVTYVAGEWNTFNGAIKVIESLYGRSMPVTYKTWSEIRNALTAHAHDEDTSALELAQVEEMMVMGCLACPKEKTARQRTNFFKDVAFRDLRTLLSDAKEMEGVL
ncbi:MAG: hypothetical protein LQ352_004673 [Teloschistes flavicans]|nr:MAG: hypothetical protein LQ352_004673 [Teloschistes flavicans]